MFVKYPFYVERKLINLHSIFKQLFIARASESFIHSRLLFNEAFSHFSQKKKEPEKWMRINISSIKINVRDRPFPIICPFLLSKAREAGERKMEQKKEGGQQPFVWQWERKRATESGNKGNWKKEQQGSIGVVVVLRNANKKDTFFPFLRFSFVNSTSSLS